MACYPPLIANDVVLLTEPLSLALVLGVVLALSDRRIVVGGVLCGLLVLTRPSAQGIALVVAIWLVTQVGWARALAFLAISVLVVTPWIVRNWVQLGAPVLVTSNGFNMAAIYSPEANADQHFVDPVFDRRFDDLRLLQFDEVAWQRRLQHLAWTSIKDDPGQVGRVVGRNLLYFFEVRPWANRQPEELDGRNLDFRAWTLPGFYLVSTLGLAGIALCWRNPVTWLLVAMVGYFTLTSLGLVAPPRLRAPFDLLCCMGLGVTVDRALRRFRLGTASTVAAQSR